VHRALLWWVVLIGLPALLDGPAYAQVARNRLWTLIESCLEATPGPGASHCHAPRADDVPDRDPRCMTTTQVWAQTAAHVAIRDLKMCGCAAPFVHGLALPLARISGIEAAELAVGIWPFAWRVAREHIPDEASIALVVNSKGRRTQDQLHIHLVRLRPNARDRFAHGLSGTVATLDDVWSLAEKLAQQHAFEDYGVLVAKGQQGDFTVLVGSAKQSLEFEYTQSTCR